MSKKAGVVIGAVLAAVVAVAVCCVVLMGGKNEAYRSIMVYQVDGNATITRERVGEMAAYENLMLQSGDSVAVASESSMRLKLDDDKYLLAEQDTLMNIVADGDDADAKTYIDLKQGSVTSEIQNKLGPNASYEVNTPNSIMAVRGTIFRVEVAKNESGETDTRLTVFEGTVSARAVMPDGTVSDEEVMVEAGQELYVEGTVMSFSDLGEPTNTDYESLPQVLQEYIEELGGDTAKNAQGIEEQEQQMQAKAEEAQEEDRKEEAQQAPGQQDTEEKPEAQEQERTENMPKSQSKAPEMTQKQQPSEKPDEEANQVPEQGLEEQQQTQPQEVMQPETPQTQPSKPQPQTQPQGSDPNKDSSSDGQSGGGGKKKTQYYTVTFQYNGSTFGTQKVKKGEKAEEPKLSPTENGAWDYDFSTKVNKNLTAVWIEK